MHHFLQHGLHSVDHGSQSLFPRPFLAPMIMPEFAPATYQFLSTQDTFTASEESPDVTKNLSGLLPTLKSIRFPVEVAEASLCLTRITNGTYECTSA
ncbi:hypothetical protein M405DRAFT_313628 [Rhizopogon salebrosus TDB-379]|nr:hypothetical protein M405DRAFT_313628 [Rhizopogon salebrosus TDB-379]